MGPVGSVEKPMNEDAPCHPDSLYGESKLEGEQLIRKNHDKHLIFRTSWVYAARGNNFAKTILRQAGEKDDLKVVADQRGAPTSAELIADITALALFRISRASVEENIGGTYHLTPAGKTTWHGFLRDPWRPFVESGWPSPNQPRQCRQQLCPPP